MNNARKFVESFDFVTLSRMMPDTGSLVQATRSVKRGKRDRLKHDDSAGFAAQAIAEAAGLHT